MAIFAKQVPLLSRVKNWLARGIFADEYAKVELQRQAFTAARAGLDEKISSFKDVITNVTYTDMLRDKLAGINPGLYSRVEVGDLGDFFSPELPEVLEEEEREQFLEKCRSLRDNQTLQTIIDYLERNQILYTARKAESLEAVNFGRATLNGLYLLREEVARLATVYEERHPSRTDKFDAHEVV